MNLDFEKKVEEKRQKSLRGIQWLLKGKYLCDNHVRQFCYGLLNSGYRPEEVYEIGLSIYPHNPYLKQTDYEEIKETFERIYYQCINSKLIKIKG